MNAHTVVQKLKSFHDQHLPLYIENKLFMNTVVFFFFKKKSKIEKIKNKVKDMMVKSSSIVNKTSFIFEYMIED